MSMQRCCPPAVVDLADRTQDAAIFKALADAKRLTLSAPRARTEDEVCVCASAGALPLEQPTVSHHLRILREAGLVTCERRGTWGDYRIAADGRDLLAAALRSL